MIDVLICFKLQPFSFHKSMRIVDAIDHRESYQLWPHQCWQRRMCRMLQPMSLLQRPIKTLHLKLCKLHDEKSRKTCRSSLHQFVNLFWLVNLPPPPASVPPPEIRFYKWLIYHWFPLIRPYWSLISGPFPISFSSSLSSLSEQSGDTGQSETSRLPSDINQQLLNDPLDLHSYKSLESTLANLLPIKKTSIISLFCKHESDESGAEAATLESRSLELRRRLGWCQLFGSPTLTLNEITTNN